MNIELEKIVQKLRDVYDIQQLMSKYAYYHIAGMHDDILEELFAKNSEGVHATVPMFGTWEGADGMQRYTDFHKYVEGDRIGLLMVHPITTPLIEVAEDGKTAKGMFFTMQQCVKQSMLPQKAGAIVNIASMAGIRGMGKPLCSAHYSASKGAVVAISMQGAVEWADEHVRVNAIAPGGVLSANTGVQMTPSAAPAAGPDGPILVGVPTGRLSQPEEIASMAAFLLSDLSGNTTGQIMIVDGGASSVGY